MGEKRRGERLVTEYKSGDDASMGRTPKVLTREKLCVGYVPGHLRISLESTQPIPGLSNQSKLRKTGELFHLGISPPPPRFGGPGDVEAHPLDLLMKEPASERAWCDRAGEIRA